MFTLLLLLLLCARVLDILGLTNIHVHSCSTLSLCSACHCWSDLSERPPQKRCCFCKTFRWQLTTIVPPSAADIVDNANKKKLFHSALNPTHCLPHMLPLPKKFTLDVYSSKDMVEYYTCQKANVTRTASSSGVCYRYA